ncbi:hypothetical protein F990_00554 [Acinetobacter tjernbergiae DSM 14971 = CIP 107465]|uniref:Uncharacterized protein n=1 Tax=Acinetobacter tjernbergiae DSM 14971 = CIP 107465 TaxID=1120928 RepID=V2V856_9GAMM|nr:hypothetical protein F990_00554 [Acinetobacter tjernbergiae DSM 14971 = CIP 107465]
MKYQPPYTITSKIIHLIAQISENIGRLTVLEEIQDSLKLRKANRIRTIQGSLAIEGNTLSTEQITAILNGKTVIAPQLHLRKKCKKCVMPLKLMKHFSNGSQAKK